MSAGRRRRVVTRRDDKHDMGMPRRDADDYGDGSRATPVRVGDLMPQATRRARQHDEMPCKRAALLTIAPSAAAAKCRVGLTACPTLIGSCRFKTSGCQPARDRHFTRKARFTEKTRRRILRRRLVIFTIYGRISYGALMI